MSYEIFGGGKGMGLLVLLQQCYCVGTDAFFTTCEAKFFSGGGFDGDVVEVDAHHGCKGFLHLGDVGGEFGTLGTDGAVDVADGVSFGCYDVHSFAEQNLGVDVLELVSFLGRVVVADLAHVCSTEDGITNGMDEHISIGVTKQSEGVLYLDATEPKVATFGELMDIKTKSDSYFTV